MKKVCVIGHFGFGENLLNGQTIKTKIVTEELEKQIGSENVYRIDTHGGFKSYLRLLSQIRVAVKDYENIVIFPAHNGLRVIAPMLAVINNYYGKRLIYVVIGGWLPDFIGTHRILSRSLKTFEKIFVETSIMKTKLEEQGFANIDLMPNCKPLKILDEIELNDKKPHQLCTFSRVMKEKGIEDAINAVDHINKLHNEVIYTLDIYGQVDENQKEWFDNLQINFPEYIKYKGNIDFDKSVETIKNYYALLFPTHFYTEGIPGTIIDSYASGVPVICSKWESFSDIVEDGITGIGYEFNDFDGLVGILDKVATDASHIRDMKIECLNRAKKYLPDKVCGKLVIAINGTEKK